MHEDHIQDIPMGALLGCNAHLARGVIEQHLQAYDMTLSQTHVVMRLFKNGGEMTQSELTHHLHVKPSTVNGLVERLEERGLVSRTTDPKDGRQRIVTLTVQGKALYAELNRGIEAGDAALTNCFTPEERDTLRALLIRMANHLEQERTVC